MQPDTIKITTAELMATATQLRESGHRLMLISCSNITDDKVLHYLFVSFREPLRPPIHLEVKTLDGHRGPIPSVREIYNQANRFEVDVTRNTNGEIIFEAQKSEAVSNFGAAIGSTQIPVGPVHAGVIEPGHFRFSVVGESILDLKIELNYLTRGVEEVFRGAGVGDALYLSEHVTGDSVIAHGLAFLKAYESCTSTKVGEDEKVRRSLLLELERLSYHILDIGALANDTAFGLANATALRLRESLFQINDRLTGQRSLRGALQFGCTCLLQLPSLEEIRSIEVGLWELVRLIEEHSIVRDRMIGTGVLPFGEAERLGTLGYVGRASGHSCDIRLYLPYNNFEKNYREVTETSGDVMARLQVRRREAFASLELIEIYLTYLQDGGRNQPNRGISPPRIPASDANFGVGLGCVEGWRGATCYFVTTNSNGYIEEVKIVDPSVSNWSALPIALHGAIVPDFPLINKSFDQSYAGHDL